jgi:hypothetical protein
MTAQSDLSQIFTAYYGGATEFPYPPVTTNSDKFRYVGFFINAYGEKWVLVYDQELGGGVLLGSDCGWEIIRLGNGDKPVLSEILPVADDMNLWIQSCWLATAHIRENEKGVSVPDNAFTLGFAAGHWGISIRTLKKDAVEGMLIAKNLGNIWITTAQAMIAQYGIPVRGKAFSLEIGEEIDEVFREESEAIRKRLMAE